MAPSKPIQEVLVVSSSNKIYEFIDHLLPPEEYEIVQKAANTQEARRILVSSEYDIVIINAPLTDEFGRELALELSSGTVGVVLLCSSEHYEHIMYQVEDAGVLTVQKPVTRNSLYSAVKLATALHMRLSKMEKKNQTLMDKMADIRVVNRAKWLLIEHLNMSEKEAHYYIEKQAMDMRLSRREVAESIIRTYDK